jgi:hypothetical protein
MTIMTLAGVAGQYQPREAVVSIDPDPALIGNPRARTVVRRDRSIAGIERHRVDRRVLRARGELHEIVARFVGRALEAGPIIIRDGIRFRARAAGRRRGGVRRFVFRSAQQGRERGGVRLDRAHAHGSADEIETRCPRAIVIAVAQRLIPALLRGPAQCGDTLADDARILWIARQFAQAAHLDSRRTACRRCGAVGLHLSRDSLDGRAPRAERQDSAACGMRRRGRRRLGTMMQDREGGARRNHGSSNA